MRIAPALLSIVAAIVAGTAVGAKPEPAPRFSMKPPANWGPLALAVIQLQGSDKRAPGYYCPPPEGPDDFCFGAAMFDQAGGIRRVLAASPTFGRKKLGIFRTIGGHAQISIRGGWYVALLERTDSGYTWVPWQAELDHGKACLPASLIKTFSITMPADAWAGENESWCFKP
jgi:hypothetical protein